MIKLIAHRFGYKMTKYPENSFDALKEIFESNEKLSVCDGFEFDICFTKDHVPVVIHDNILDDVCSSGGKLKCYTFEDLKEEIFEMKDKFRGNKEPKFKLVKLDDVLHFFLNNRDRLGNKLIKIETKERLLFRKKDRISFINILNKYSQLESNLVHLSFFTSNLIMIKNKLKDVKIDLLCKYYILFTITYFLFKFDIITVNSKIFNKTYKSILKKCGVVGVYTINGRTKFNKITNCIEDDSIIYVTTDNPMELIK